MVRRKPDLRVGSTPAKKSRRWRHGKSFRCAMLALPGSSSSMTNAIRWLRGIPVIESRRRHNEIRNLQSVQGAGGKQHFIVCPSSTESQFARIMRLTSRQLYLDLDGGLSRPHSAKVAAAIEKLSAASGAESRGAIFTRVEVVEFVLDLVGYTEDHCHQPGNAWINTYRASTSH